ncbi:MAG: ABC transporter substrate-binding protein [Clostridia bacterium]|nr:ABC transporter substrate-binding protein [Clostridia bacterium]
MKKIITCVLALVLVFTLGFCLCGCGQSTAKYKVGICQLIQHDALDQATKGFQDALKEKLGDDVEFDLQIAADEPATCSTIVNSFVSAKADLIMANATPALQAAASATDEIPIVATSITDYASALSIDNWTGKTGMNITGTSDLAPLGDQANMFKELLPNAKKVGILYNSGEANSKYQAVEVGKALTESGFEIKEYTSADSNDIAQVVTSACADMDAIYIPTDNTMASNTEIINNIADPAGIPIIAGEANICKGCGIATLSIDYYSIGYEAGLLAYDILANGKNPGEIEIGYASELTKQYVASRCEKLGVTIPAGYEAIDMSEAAE